MPSTTTTAKRYPRLSWRQKQRLERILSQATLFIEYDFFHQATEIMNQLRKKVDVGPDESLTAEQERTLFLQLNYYRYRRETLRHKLLNQKFIIKRDHVLQLFHWDSHQHNMQSRLVSHNLGLVSHMVRHCSFENIDYEELISEGNVGLLRSIDRYDCMRGFRFSTYACRAIMLSISRYAKKQYTMWRRYPVSWEPSYETPNDLEEKRDEQRQDQINLVVNLIKKNQADLSQMEQSVLEKRFTLNDPEGKIMTLKAIGQELDLSKERVRQIQNQALNKVRQTVMEHPMYLS